MEENKSDKNFGYYTKHNKRTLASGRWLEDFSLPTGKNFGDVGALFGQSYPDTPPPLPPRPPSPVPLNTCIHLLTCCVICQEQYAWDVWSHPDSVLQQYAHRNEDERIHAAILFQKYIRMRGVALVVDTIDNQVRHLLNFID